MRKRGEEHMSTSPSPRELAERQALVVEDDISLQPAAGNTAEKLDPNSDLGWITSYDEGIDNDDEVLSYLVEPIQVASPTVVPDVREPVSFEWVRQCFYAALVVVGLVYFFSLLSGSMVRANALNFGTALLGPTTNSATHR
jgi:hypothetical protein